MPGKVNLPGTLKRSPAKAQRTYTETLESAEEQYGDGERAHRTAIASLKHGFEKVGDHWEPKKEKGPSDPRAAKGGNPYRRNAGESFGGVDFYGSTVDELRARAKGLGISGRWKMDKKELARAIDRKQD
ncbi:MAG TPA: ChaB family protein [Candidatus Limnocylindrales bacterium]|nr:ChaB family protein [Candidatus Limnocylindrales bacterium]